MATACQTTAYRRRRGLTLLEVIVAMTVLSIGIVSVVGAVAACLRSTDASAAYSRAALLAEQVTAELARNETLEPGTHTGTFEEQDLHYTWSAQIASADDEGLYPVQVTVNWENDLRRYTLETSLRPQALPGPPPAEGNGNGAPPAEEDGTPGGANGAGAGGNMGGTGGNPGGPAAGRAR